MLNQRNVTIKTLTLGTPETIDLPRNEAIRNIFLRLAGSVTISGGTTSGAVKAQGLWHTISNIALKREGRDTLIDLPGNLLYELNKLLYKTAPSLANLANGDAQTNTAVNGSLIIPLENIGGVKPFDTLLKAQGLSDLRLNITTQAVSNMVIGGDRVHAVGTTAFTLAVDVDEEVGVNNFEFSDIVTRLAAKSQVSAASSAFQIKPLPTGNLYKGIMLYAEDASAGSNSLITNIKLKSGYEVLVDRPANNIREYNKNVQAIETLGTGVYYLDLMGIDGMLNNCLNTLGETGRNSLELELNVAAPGGTAYVYVVTLEYVPSPTIRDLLRAKYVNK